MTGSKSIAGVMSQGALAASLAFLPGVSFAQTATPAVAPGGPDVAIRLPPVDIQGSTPSNTLNTDAGVNRIPGRVQDTPQSIQVVPREVLQQQNVTTLDQALRNVPGITSSIGEGNGGVSGDQFRIRGFNAQNDLFVDGLRDFGAYTRDAFTYEEVQVLQGPSGFALGGAGTVGGGVNIRSRAPHLGNEYGAVLTGGSGLFARGTADANVQVGSSSAVRLNLMGQDSRVPGRDEVYARRWGVAPSIAFGLGTDTTLSVEYLHYEYDQSTDAGIPIITPFGRVGRPATELGLPRNTYYGIDNDRDQVRLDRLTARLSHRVADWLTLSNDFRVSWLNRDIARSIVNCPGGATIAAYNVSCSAAFLNGRNFTANPNGPGNPYVEDTFGVQNVGTAVARFNTGPVRHEAVGGFDIFRAETDRTGYSLLTQRPNVTIRDPENDGNFVRGGANNFRSTEQTQLSLFLRDRVWIIPEVSIIGGLRYTRSWFDYAASTPPAAQTVFSRNEDFVDPQASLVYEPTRNQTYYFTYSTSTTPTGVNFTTLPSTVNPNTSPERNRSYEVGAKVGILDGGRLGLYGALFRIDKNNAFETLDDGSVFQTSDRQRVQGFEVGTTGRITPDWNINLRYSLLDSEITRSTTVANVGNRVQFVPRHSVSLWTTYELGGGTPYNATLGGGVTYRSRVFLNAANNAEAPGTFSLDALVSHKLTDNIRVSVNGYNLTNRRNYDSLFTNRAVISPSRTVLGSVSFTF